MYSACSDPWTRIVPVYLPRIRFSGHSILSNWSVARGKDPVSGWKPFTQTEIDLITMCVGNTWGCFGYGEPGMSKAHFVWWWGVVSNGGYYQVSTASSRVGCCCCTLSLGGTLAPISLSSTEWPTCMNIFYGLSKSGVLNPVGCCGVCLTTKTTHRRDPYEHTEGCQEWWSRFCLGWKSKQDYRSVGQEAAISQASQV